MHNSSSFKLQFSGANLYILEAECLLFLHNSSVTICAIILHSCILGKESHAQGARTSSHPLPSYCVTLSHPHKRERTRRGVKRRCVMTFGRQGKFGSSAMKISAQIKEDPPASLCVYKCVCVFVFAQGAGPPTVVRRSASWFFVPRRGEGGSISPGL